MLDFLHKLFVLSGLLTVLFGVMYWLALGIYCFVFWTPEIMHIQDWPEVGRFTFALAFSMPAAALTIGVFAEV